MTGKIRTPRPIEYRPMRQKDVEQVLLMEQGLFEGTDRLAQRQAQMETYLRYWGSYGHQESPCVVAVRGPEVLGYAIGNRRKHPSSTVSLVRVMVKNGRRRQGLGRELLALFERRAWMLGASMVTASINTDTAGLLSARRWDVSEPGQALSRQERPSREVKRSTRTQKLKSVARIITLKPAEPGRGHTAVKELSTNLPLHWFHNPDAAAVTALLAQNPEAGPQLHCSTILDRLTSLSNDLGWEATGKLLQHSKQDGEDAGVVQQLWLDWRTANVPAGATVVGGS